MYFFCFIISFTLKCLKKLILCIGGGKESIPGIQIAKKMGFSIILVDQSKKAKAKKLCDYFIPETKNPNKILKKISLTLKKKIFGVISFGNDVPYEVNFIAKKLNLNHYNLNAARILSDKFLTRKF